MEVKKYQYYAGGVWRDAEGGRTFDDLEPYSGKVYAKVAAAGKNDMKIALKAAAEAFPAWAATTPAQRAELLFKAAAIIKRRRVEIAEILAKETGSTISFAHSSRTCLHRPLRSAQDGLMKLKEKFCKPMCRVIFDGIPQAARYSGKLYAMERRKHTFLAHRNSPIVAGNTVVVNHPNSHRSQQVL